MAFVLFPRLLSILFSISVEVGVVAHSGFRSTTATGDAFFLLHGNVLVVIDWDIVTYFSGCSDESLVFYRDSQVVLKSVLVGRLDSRSDNFFVFSQNRLRLLEVYL